MGKKKRQSSIWCVIMQTERRRKDCIIRDALFGIAEAKKKTGLNYPCAWIRDGNEKWHHLFRHPTNKKIYYDGLIV